MKYLSSIVIGIVLAVPAYCQITHNATPIDYEVYTDGERISAFLKFFELRMRAHDYKYCEYAFSDTVIVNGFGVSRDQIETNFRQSFDYRNVDTEVLRQQFLNRGANFFPDYTIKDSAHGFPPLQEIGTRFIVRFKVSVSPDQPDIGCEAMLEKVRQSNKLPVTDFVIVECNDGFLESVGEYAYNFILSHVGEGGEVLPEWQSDYWYDNWDFLHDMPKPCVNDISNFSITNKALYNARIDVHIPGGNPENVSYEQIDRSVTTGDLQREYLGVISDFLTMKHQGSIYSSLYVLDKAWNRIVLASLQEGRIRVSPWYDPGTQQVSGPSFERPQAMDVSTSGYMGIIDISRRKFSRLALVSEREGLTQVYQSDVIPFGSWSPSRLRLNVTSMNGSGLSNALWLGGYLPYPSIKIYPDNNINWSDPYFTISGCTYQCSGVLQDYYFTSSPLFYVDDIYHPSRWTSATFKGVCIYDNNRIYITRDGDSFYSKDTSNLLLNAINIHDLSYISDVKMIDQDGDMRYLVSDVGAQLIHVFEPYEGQYVCSWAPPNASCFDNLVGIRNSSYWSESATSIAEEYDLYVAEQWDDSHGFRRYLPDVDILDIQRKETRNTGVPKPSLLSFTAAQRMRYDVYVDSMLVDSGRITDIRRVQLSVPNASGEIIKLYCEPSGNGNYDTAFTRPVKIYTILPDGSVQKGFRQSSPKTNLRNVTLYANYPNPVRSHATIPFKLTQADYVSIRIYNASGVCTQTLPVHYYQEGYHEISFELTVKTPGIYYYCFSTSNDVKIKRLIIQ